MLSKPGLLILGGSFLFVGLLTSFALGGRSPLNPRSAQASTLASPANPAAGFKWSMPKRFGPKNSAGMVDYHWNEDTQTYDSAYVNPSSWIVEFDACTPPAVPNSTFQWEIDGGVVANPNPAACTFSHQFTAQKTYQVKLTVTTPDGQAAVAETGVAVKDLLIVSIGDSFASGQGNPDIPKQGSTRAKWVDSTCHRSEFAGPAQAALSIEQADPHTSVTFVSLACSGATIEAGLTGVYLKNGKSLPPQIDKVKEAVNGRPIDALLISIGGNDIGFADLVAKCIVQINCSTNNETLAMLKRGLDSLQARYQTLSERLNGLQPTKIFITEYPDLARDQDRQSCRHAPLGDLLSGFSRDESEWASEQVIKRGLNERIKAAADAHGWVYVTGIADGFVNHGFCAGDQRWVRTFRDAKRIQGTDNKCDLFDLGSIRSCIISSGSVHPNGGGHAWYATRLIEELQKAGITTPIGP
jgi:lysophospholipase L1-like esterase